MNRREREILNGVFGMLDQALRKLGHEPADEEHARGWVTVALEEVDTLLAASPPPPGRSMLKDPPPGVGLRPSLKLMHLDDEP
jgi:hypothetical protein